MFKESGLIKILQYGVFVLLFTPLVVKCNTIFPFIFGRVLLIQAIIGVLFGFWIILIYLYPNYRPKKSLIATALLIYFGVIFVASIFGTDFSQSFWGNTERMGGIFTYLHFLALFFILQTIFRGWEEWKRFFSISLIASSLMCVVALLQRDGIGLINLCGVEKTSRVTGTTDNPIFFAAYLMFHIFISGLLTIKIKSLAPRIIFVSLGILNFITFFLTESKGALIAFIIASLFLVLGYLLLSDNKKLKKILIILVLFSVILGSLFFVFKDSKIISENRVMDNITSISFTGETASTRMLSWGVAYEAWKEKPILGWGWDNFFIAFNKHYNPELLSFSLYETWFDRSHNILFDQLVMTGSLGLLSYLFIFIAVLWALIKLFKQKTIDKHIFIFSSVIFIGYFIQNLFAFDSPSTLLLFISFLAFIIGVSEKSNSKNTEIKKPMPIIFFAFGICLISIIFNYQVYNVNVYGMKGIVEVYRPFEERKNIVTDALERWTPYKEEVRLDIVNDFALELAAGTIPENKVEEYFKEMEVMVLDNINEHPSHTFYPFALGRLYSDIYSYDQIKYSEYYQKSEDSFKKALVLSPDRQQIYYGLGRLYLASGEYEKMKENYNIMISLNPDVSDPYWFFGSGLLSIGEQEEAYANIRKAVGLNYYPRTKDDLEIITNAFLVVDQYDELINIYENQVILESDITIIPSADFCAKIAVIYAERGEKEKAKEAALRAVSLDPGFQQEAEIFIELLGF